MTETSEIFTTSIPSVSESWSDIVLLRAGKVNCLWSATLAGRRFILKGLRPEFRHSTPHRLLLEKEYQVAANLDHPFIVRMLDKGYMDAIGEYIRMEYVDGHTMIGYSSNQIPKPSHGC